MWELLWGCVEVTLLCGMFVAIEKDLFSHAAIYIDDYFNATDTFFMSGD